MHIETTARCPRTPVVLFALEEAGVPYTLQVRPDGHFEEHYQQSGPAVHVGEELRLGLAGALGTLRGLPSLQPRDPDDAARSDRWMTRLEALRPTLVALGAAARAGRPPPPEALAAVRAFTADLEAELEAVPWLGGATPAAADLALLPLGILARAGVPLPPLVQAWLGRLLARPAWSRVVAAFPGAAG